VSSLRRKEHTRPSLPPFAWLGLALASWRRRLSSSLSHSPLPSFNFCSITVAGCREGGGRDERGQVRKVRDGGGRRGGQDLHAHLLHQQNKFPTVCCDALPCSLFLFFFPISSMFASTLHLSLSSFRKPGDGSCLPFLRLLKVK
jgi:hypothetical protein